MRLRGWMAVQMMREWAQMRSCTVAYVILGAGVLASLAGIWSEQQDRLAAQDRRVVQREAEQCVQAWQVSDGLRDALASSLSHQGEALIRVVEDRVPPEIVDRYRLELEAAQQAAQGDVVDPDCSLAEARAVLE